MGHAKRHVRHIKKRWIRKFWYNRYTWTTKYAILQIRNDRNHRNVDIAAGRAVRHQKVHTWNRHNGWNQRWRVVNVRGWYFQLKSLKGNMYFGNRGGFWAGLQRRPTWLHYNTRYHSLMRGRKCLDIWHGNFNNGQPLVWWNCHHGMNQHFSLVWVGGHRVVRKHYRVRRHVRVAKKKVFKRVFRYGWTGYHGWSAIGGRLRQISIGQNGVQWGVAANDTIWTRTTGGWRNVRGRLYQISVSDDGKVWGVNRAHYIFVLLNAHRGQWKVIPGRLKQVSVGKNHNVWGVNRYNSIYARIGGINGHWKYIPGRLTNISVGYNGQVWGVNPYHRVYWRNGLKGGWRYVPSYHFRQVTVGSKGRVFATSIWDTIYTRVGVKGRWQSIPGRLRWIATNSRNQVTGTNKYNMIYFALSAKARKIVRKWSKRAIHHPKRTHKIRKVKVHQRKGYMKKKISKRARKVMKRKVSKKI